MVEHLLKSIEELTREASFVPGKVNEKKWSRAKRQAAKQGHKDNWAYVNKIFQEMKKASGRKKKR